MSFEYAANPNKMASYLSSFNSANLGKVAHTGTIENAKSDVNTVLNNAAAEDKKHEMYYKGLASEATMDHRAEMARMEMDANRTNSWISAGTSAAFGAMKGSDFSLFGGGGTDTMGASDLDAFGRSAADQRTLSSGGFIDHGYI